MADQPKKLSSGQIARRVKFTKQLPKDEKQALNVLSNKIASAARDLDRELKRVEDFAKRAKISFDEAKKAVKMQDPSRAKFWQGLRTRALQLTAAARAIPGLYVSQTTIPGNQFNSSQGMKLFGRFAGKALDGEAAKSLAGLAKTMSDKFLRTAALIPAELTKKSPAQLMRQAAESRMKKKAL